MPFYQILHSVELSPEQKDALATAITNAHCGATGALKLFVNIEFHHNTNPYQYVGGQRRPNNKIIGFTRSRGTVGADLMNDVVSEVNDQWNKIVGSDGEKELGALWITDGILTGIEFGHMLPKAFEDNDWFEEHKKDFERRAALGDQVFVDALDSNVIHRG
ncbi:hypothetical protein DRE_01144 [Drechslerella stenobrocha 248]|uniref:Tautomerase cis-CaaD-like domain-containing protein n=1 Tax=Drechslerella stenobrocha 248 TaxID=1043628 RepID=W7HWL3_9PEZI|nr:hypothetical protein DRE_01144 [Drechslerella stenobrocha 248]